MPAVVETPNPPSAQDRTDLGAPKDHPARQALAARIGLPLDSPQPAPEAALQTPAPRCA